MTSLHELVSYIDRLLGIASTPDYPQAVNGLQLENSGEVHKIAAAVDFSGPAVSTAIEAKADLLLVHHGMFWSGPSALTGAGYARLRALIQHDVAVYSAHLPLDRHAELGNAVLLARELGLRPSGEFALFKSIAVGTRGEDEIATGELVERARSFARRHGGDVRTSPLRKDQVTKRWGICTGAGASAETLAEARERGIDTLIVGEGPHWTAVAAADSSPAIIYAGHYATETLGVSALAKHVAERFSLAWKFLELPTGL